MSGLAPPPLDFASLMLATIEVRPVQLTRLVPTKHLTADPFRHTSLYRFDAPDGSFGVLYAAFDLETAFVESIVRDHPHRLPADELLLIDYATLESRQVVTFKEGIAARSLCVAKLYEEGLSAVRTDNQISTVDDYATTQLWGKAFHEHPQKIDGIAYMSRFMGSRRSVVLFDRARDVIAIDHPIPLLHHPDLAPILDAYRIGLVAVPKKRRKKRVAKKKKRKKKTRK
jgi:hypothetical protein